MEETIEKLIEKKKEINSKIKNLKQEKKKMSKNSDNHSNVLMRVSKDFSDEIEDVIEKREEKGLTNDSRPKLAGLIVKHKFWSKIKTDLINYIFKSKGLKNNKRGQLTFFIITLIVFALMLCLFLFASGLVVVKVDQALDQDISIGQVNLKDINDETFGMFADTFVNNADWWGVATIFGMILGLIISAYIVRNRFPKLGVILDIFFILVAFIFSLYISSTYQTILDAFQTAGEPFLEDHVAKTSFFVLNLPVFVPILGAVLMILFHSSIPKKDDEKYQEGGYLQGVQ